MLCRIAATKSGIKSLQGRIDVQIVRQCHPVVKNRPSRYFDRGVCHAVRGASGVRGRHHERLFDLAGKLRPADAGSLRENSGIHVKFIRFSSGEALARVIAEKNNPQIDVLFGGPVETFTAGQAQGIFESYTPPGAADLPARFKDKGGAWTAIADDPLVFMTNTAFLKQNNLQAPASWDDLLNPAYKNMLQMADARTSGTAVTRIFSVLQVHNRNEDEAFAYMKKLRQNVQLYTKSGGGGTLPVGLGQAGGGIFFIVDALVTRRKGYDVQI